MHLFLKFDSVRMLVHFSVYGQMQKSAADLTAFHKQKCLDLQGYQHMASSEFAEVGDLRS